jgi:putative hemolysin
VASEKLVDVEEVIRKKNPRLAKALPRFILGYLKRIVHQDLVNKLISDNKDTYGLDFVANILKLINTTYIAEGVENIPPNGRFIFASNHPLGGLDGIVLLDAVGKHYPDVKFVVNDLLMNVKNLEPVFLPINKHGRQNVDYARKLDASYSSNTQILYFPAGLCSRKVKGKIVDLSWQKSFIVKSTQYQRDIIPVYFDGRNSNFFYNLANLRKRLKLKANIEMLYLVDEMYKQRGRKMRLVFGKPIPYQTFDASKTPSEWALFVRQKVYELKK